MELEQKSNGALVGSVIIIIILIVGGIYLWKTGVQRNTTTPTYDESTNIETELNSMDLDNLDQDI